MIESCSAKRMLICIIVLGGLTLLVLIIESHWTGNNQNLPTVGINTTDTHCWLKETYTVIEECQPCSDFEITSQSNEACKETHYKEAVQCKTSGKVYKSCAKVTWLEEHKFWKFQILMFVFSVLSTCLVYWRQAVLNHRVMNMSGVYISIETYEEFVISCSIESAIVLCVYKYLDNESESAPPLNLVLSSKPQSNCSVEVDISRFDHTVKNEETVNSLVNSCVLPAYSVKSDYCISGFCAVLRQLVKSFTNDRWLLGFREVCLSACAEFSVWTKFCEIDLISSVKVALAEELSEIPVNFVRLEYHLLHPVRTHNIGKKSISYAKKNSIPKSNITVVEHCYVEGSEMVLSDLIILPLVNIFSNLYGLHVVSQLLPLTYKWRQLMLSDDRIRNSLSVIKFDKTWSLMEEPIVPANVKMESLYKCDPRRYKCSEKVFTKQEDVERVLRIVDSVDILEEYDTNNVPSENFNWNNVPYYAHPKGGSLPDDRLCRKMQQIENIVISTVQIAQKGDTIVDFCCGVGHVGILLAYLLPDCNILLLDNKEHSMWRAYERIQFLELKNISVIQSNIDYFEGKFQVGVTLHACGVATDLVINKCILNRSKFVVSPCCYGKLQKNHILNYPRSEVLRSLLSDRDYLILGHSADQTHKEEYSKSDQGEKCMKYIDVDRCLHAKENNYRIQLFKMIPVTCSPKNNFITGIPVMG